MRKPVAMLAMMAYLGVYIWLISLIAPLIAQTHQLVQLVFFAMAGFIWIFPLKPLFAWMNVGTPPPE